MGTGKTILVTWQSVPTSAMLVLESVLLEAQKTGSFDPCVIEAGTPSAPTRHRRRAPGKDEMPVLDPREFIARDMGKGKNPGPLDSKDFFVLVPPASAEPLMKRFSSVWVFLTPDSLSAPLIFRLLDAANPDNGTGPAIFLWIMGTSTVEKAVQEFLRIEGEIASLSRRPFRMAFAGYFEIDPEKARIAGSVPAPLIDCFPGDSFHGAVKAALRKISMSLEPEGEADGQGLRKTVALLAGGAAPKPIPWSNVPDW
jgi:hypothetical protein